MELTQILTIAAKEFRDRMRNRWVLAVALVFTVFSLVIAYFGGAQQGAVGFRSIEFTIASLVSLVIYLIPLIALLLGFDAIVGERERGSLDLLLSLPITRLELLLGKYLGLAAALTLSTLAGFGLVAVLLVRQFSGAALFHYGGFMISSVLLGLAFLSMAVLLSVLTHERTRASGLAIAAWFFFVLVFDLLLLGALVATGGSVGGEAMAYLLLLNPADVFRILNVFSLDDVRTLYGLTSIVPPALAKPWLMGAVMAGWIVVPLARSRLEGLAGSARALPFPNGLPGATNGVAALKLQTGTPLLGGGAEDRGFVSIPDLALRHRRSRLLADGAGVVLAVDAEVGQVVAAGTPVVRLALDGPRDARKSAELQTFGWFVRATRKP